MNEQEHEKIMGSLKEVEALMDSGDAAGALEKFRSETRQLMYSNMETIHKEFSAELKKLRAGKKKDER